MGVNALKSIDGVVEDCIALALIDQHLHGVCSLGVIEISGLAWSILKKYCRLSCSAVEARNITLQNILISNTKLCSLYAST